MLQEKCPSFFSTLKSLGPCSKKCFKQANGFSIHTYLHCSTAVAWREKKFKHFVFNKYFSLVLGVLKSKISKKSNEGLGRKLDFKLFHYKARVELVGKITTIATRNRC